MKVLVLISALLSITQACNPLSGFPDIIRGYAYAIVNTQVNQTQTDCYKDSDRLANKF
jgi:hypothetical protein